MPNQTPKLSSLRGKQLAGKHASPDGLARTLAFRPQKRRSLKKRFSERLGSRMIGKSNVTGRYD